MDYEEKHPISQEIYEYLKNTPKEEIDKDWSYILKETNTESYYEQKYKDALERARELQENSNGMILKKWLWGVFPELRECEDERIRKALIEMIHDTTGDECEDCYHISKESVLSWLEKQGEKKNTTHKREIDDAYLQGVCDAKHEIEKQGENKPTYKVEPKFKVGDWIVNNVCFPMQIASIKDGMYVFTKGDAMSVLFIDGNFHLWTIEDVEDGDVLVEDSYIFIIQKLGYNSTIAKTYCTLHSDGDFDDGSTLYFDIDSIKPATKEQQDLLFQKIKEAGYEWDAQKKELKKIEPKKVNVNKVIEWINSDEAIEWLNENVADFWASPCNPQNIINQFKKDFGL